jgi:polyisoprenoid-binding protein YceI
MRSRIVYAAALATLLQWPTAHAAGVTYRVNPARSHATIHVGKAGVFSFIAGHSHEVTGPIQSGSLDVDRQDPERSRVHLVIATSELKVSASGEPEGDVPKVQEAMAGDRVLDVAHHPRLTYESTAVALKDRRGNALDLTVTGQLTIRSVARPITVPVHVELANDALVATGHFAIKQSAFGITPISVGGVVAVKDTLEIEFSISANKS